jgi:hypothetical protein
LGFGDPLRRRSTDKTLGKKPLLVHPEHHRVPAITAIHATTGHHEIRFGKPVLDLTFAEASQKTLKGC